MLGLSFSSFVFESINFLALVWVLSRVLYRPIQKSLKSHREHEEARLRAAEEADAELRARKEEMDRRERELLEVRGQMLKKAAAEAEVVRVKSIEKAEEEVRLARARGQGRLDAERREASGRITELAIDQSMRICAKLMVELLPAEADRVLIERLARTVGAHREELQRESPKDAMHVKLRMARKPTDEELQEVKERFERALGGSLEIETDEDASLVAGAVAKVGHRVFDASIAGNLALLESRARELSREMLDG